ncbi:hypothetical protein SRHO_G00045460 [Serrasalmus rhombeus]
MESAWREWGPCCEASELIPLQITNGGISTVLTHTCMANSGKILALIAHKCSAQTGVSTHTQQEGSRSGTLSLPHLPGSAGGQEQPAIGTPHLRPGSLMCAQKAVRVIAFESPRFFHDTDTQVAPLLAFQVLPCVNLRGPGSASRCLSLALKNYTRLSD